MKKILLISIVTIGSSTLFAQVKNISKVEVPRVEVKDKASVSNLSDGEVSSSVTYTDALGRTIQNISMGNSPDGNDIVSSAVYDEYGRQQLNYLPFVTDNTTGAFQTNWESQLNTFYNGTTVTIPGETKPYNKVTFEPSVLGRSSKVYGVGDRYITNDKFLQVNTGTNTGTDVKKWRTSATGLITTSSYKTNILRFSEMISPEGKRNRVYKDLHGNTIVSKVFDRTEEIEEEGPCLIDPETGDCASAPLTITRTVEIWRETHYVYDDLNNLIFILPPKLAALESITESQLDMYAFRFEYDQKGRLIAEKKPGAGWSYFIYDKWGRQVLSQSAVQGMSDQWSFIKYDQYNRAVMFGVYTPGKTVDQLRTETAAHTIRFEQTNSSGIGYTLSRTYPTTTTESDLLILSYYDSYDYLNNTGWDAEGHDYTYQKPAGFDPLKSPLSLNDLPTATKVKILDSDHWLNTVTYFDIDGQPTQIISENHLGGIDRLTLAYDFTGNVTKTLLNHTSTTDAVRILEESEYDHAGRLLREYHTIDSGPRVLMAAYSYNALGQVIEKNIHESSSGQFLQSVDYRYDIEGRSKSINNSTLTAAANNDDDNDLFGLELVYGDEQLNVAGSAVDLDYDGKLTAVKWNADFPDQGKKEKAYGLTYDKFDQLNEAKYGAGSNYQSDAGLFDVSYAYDEHGNVERIQRYGQINGTRQLLDDLTLHYEGNRLIRVEDAGSSEGFNNGTAGIDDYGYDAAGNMSYDLNRSITAFAYNKLSLTESITHGSKLISYLYDATGAKLGTTYSTGGTTEKVIDNVGGIQYVDGQIVSVATSHGRAIKIRDAYYYEYTLTDHLGNQRVAFGLLPETFVYKATMEDAFATTENTHFDNVDATRTFLPSYNHTLPGVKETSPNKVARLNGSTQAIGPAKVLEVGAGDKISMEVYAGYIEGTGGNNAVLSDLAGALTTSLDLAVQPELASAVSALNNALPVFSASVDEHNNVPKAYLNYIYFDENFENPQFGYEEVTTNGHNRLQRLSLEVESPGAGYMFVYVANESTVPSAEVYFDDLTIVHQTTSTALQVTQASDYYPFGMPFNYYENEGIADMQYLYQGKQLEEEVNLYDFHARMYDPATGRFLAIDPQGQFASPFNGMGNNPMMMVDPDGELAWFVVPAIVGVITGAINAASRYEDGDSFWDVAGSFGVGFVAGAAASLGAAAVAPAATAALGTGALGGAAIGAVGGAISGFALGAGNTWLDGGSFQEGFGNGMIGAGTGALIGGITGGMFQGTSAVLKGRNFWTGAVRPTPVGPTVVRKGASPLKTSQSASDRTLAKVDIKSSSNQVVQNADDPLNANGLKVGKNDFTGKTVTVDKTAPRLGHIFRDAPGHVNPSTAASQARYLELFQKVASNPANLRVDAATVGLIPQQAAKAGVRVYTQTFSQGQVWVFIRNGQIINGGVNPINFVR